MPHQPNFPTKKGFTFYTIINTAILEHRMLGLPTEFIRHFGDDLYDAAVLKVPTGKLWAVEVVKTNEGTFFHNGWHEFVRYYSISAGQLLVFTYDESCRFCVRILDNRSRCEIDYERNSNYSEQFNSIKGFPMPTKENNASPNKHNRSSKDGAIQAANCLNLKHPFFTVVMRPSYVQSGHPPIPRSFVKSYFTKKVGSVTLAVPDGRTWDVGCFSNNRDYYILRKGWRAFQTTMDLKEGNVCVFELIRSMNVMFKVYILRDV